MSSAASPRVFLNGGDISAMESGSGNPGYYNAKQKASYNILEQLAVQYNCLDEKTTLIINVGSSVGTLILIRLMYAVISDAGFFVVTAALVMSMFFMAFALWLLAWIYRFDEGPSEMRTVTQAIQDGAEGYVQVQYGTIRNIAIAFAVILWILYFSKDTGIGEAGSTSVAFITSLTFLAGAGCSGLSGYGGMWISVRTNGRTANAARRCYNDAIQLCFRGGAFCAVINVALVVSGISTMMIFSKVCYPRMTWQQMPLLLVGYGFGASLVAMFAQLGGGIYTKAADVGADLCGKVEQGIPEDDPRNPAVVADLVGDNVGDCAGQCADTFESIAAEIMAAMILGGSLSEKAKFSDDVTAGFVLFPLAVHCLDLVVSSVGILLVRTKPGMPGEGSSYVMEDPLAIMKRAYMVTIVLGMSGFAWLCSSFLYTPSAPHAWKCFAACGALGIVVAYLFVLITQLYTDYEYYQVRHIAECSVTGPGTNIISGLAVGMESTAMPVLLIVVALVSAFNMGRWSGVAPEGEEALAGLFGTAVATMGMLSTAVFVLTMSSFGPIADNAGGIVEMSQQPERVRDITDKLDAIGNVTKANTKGFSVGSASLACFLLFRAFLDEVEIYTKERFDTVNLAVPEVFCGGLLGAMVVFLFSSMAFKAVGKAAHEVVKEVRRQFQERPGIMDYSERPDYHRCVALVSKAALQRMVAPGLLSILSPMAVGFVFRQLGQYNGMPNLGVQAVAAFLMFSTSTGILMALFLNNAGGAWDNAKKYVEMGMHGGKGSEAHKAAVVGDTVGDPAKDTAGPSVHVLIKLVSTVTLVVTPLFIGPQTGAAVAAGAAAVGRDNADHLLAMGAALGGS
eukprot:TRINITY_DN315_c8_g1_i1.p1 TRINITY_DN315_c8_g1~~TRINITY_DN315_c8_g1_i1.p1  ORF type:complete len:849 (-),score=164.79 TRINITY_DN315_c8_g1_i1:63-2609(-)